MVIVNHLKPLLPNLISLEKTRFMEGRQILNGFGASKEIVHSLKARKLSGMIINLYLSKAYECLSYAYLNSILSDFGFDQC